MSMFVAHWPTLNCQCTLRESNLQLCVAEIEKRGYKVLCVLLDAEWYGLPQGRKRVYLMCIRAVSSDLNFNMDEFFEHFKLTLRQLYITMPAADTRLIGIVFSTVLLSIPSQESGYADYTRLYYTVLYWTFFNGRFGTITDNNNYNNKLNCTTFVLAEDKFLLAENDPVLEAHFNHLRENSKESSDKTACKSLHMNLAEKRSLSGVSAQGSWFVSTNDNDNDNDCQCESYH